MKKEDGYLFVNDCTARAATGAAKEEPARMLDRITDAFVSLDTEWRYIYVNRKAEGILNRRPEDLIGKNIWTVFPEAVGQPIYNVYHKSLIEQVPLQVEEYFPWLERWFESRIYPSEAGLDIFFHDITERKMAAEARRENEQQYEHLVHSIDGIVREESLKAFFTATPAGLVILDDQLRHVRVNETLARLNDLPVAEHIGRTIREAVPGVAPIVEPILLKILRTGEPELNLELTDEVPGTSGIVRHLAASFFPLIDSFGKVTGVGGLIVDETERVQAMEHLRAGEARMRLIVEQIPAVIWTTDLDLRFTSTMGAGLARLQVPSAEKEVAQSLFEYFQTEDPDFKPIAAHHRVLRGESVTYDMEWMGRVFETHVEPLCDSNKEIIGCVGVALDVTGRKRAEEARRESEVRFRTIFEEAGIGIALVDPSGRLVEGNPALCQMLGYSSDELKRMTFKQFTHPDDAQADWSLFQELVAGKRESYQMEKRYFRKTGELIWARLTVSLVRDREGNAQYGIGMAIDITERKRADESLRKAEERFRALVENSADGIALINAQGATFYASPAMNRIFALAMEDVNQTLRLDLVHPDDRGRVLDLWNELRATPGKLMTIQYRVRYKDRTWRWLDATAHNLLSNPSVQGVVVNFRNITERKQAEDERARLVQEVINIQEAERRRIAQDLHDQLKGDLAALNWEVDSLRRRMIGIPVDHMGEELSPPRELSDSLDSIRELEDLCSQLVQKVDDIVWMLRPPELEESFPTALKDYLDRWSHRYKIRAEFACSGCDDALLRPQIERELYRIMQEGLTNVRRHAEARFVTLRLECDERHVHISLKDDGKGFDVEAVKNDPGKDRGLGLTGMKERVALLGGRIIFKSAPGQGTEVIVDVPLPMEKKGAGGR